MTDTDNLYSQISEQIRSHFEMTVRGLEPLTKSYIDRGFGFEKEDPWAYGEERKIAGLFNLKCYYQISNDAYVHDMCKEAEVLINKNGKYYIAGPGEAKTINLMATASDFEEEYLIADIMIAAACNEIARGDRWNCPVPLARTLSMNAKVIMEKNGYGWWQPSTKNYVYRKDDSLIKELRKHLLAASPEADKIAGAIMNEFAFLTDDSECEFEIVWAYNKNKDCFLYEQEAARRLKVLIQKHSYGEISDGELAHSILYFEDNDRKRLACSYDIDKWDKNFVQMINARIDNVLCVARSRIPDMSLALQEYEEKMQKEKEETEKERRELEKQEKALIEQGYDPLTAMLLSGIDF